MNTLNVGGYLVNYFKLGGVALVTFLGIHYQGVPWGLLIGVAAALLFL